MKTEDYKTLADNDLGGDLVAAVDAMNAQTETTNPEVMITYRSIGAGVGLAESAELEAAIQASSALPSWVHDSLTTEGINVNDPQVSTVLSSLVSASIAASIMSLGAVTKPKNRISNRHLAKARAMRSEGRI